MITPQISSADITTNLDSANLDRLKLNGSKREQLKKVSQEFESIFVAKMISLMDKTVDKKDGIFGEENSYMDKFKSFMFNEMGRQIAQNPVTTFGFAKQMYSQMEKTLPVENVTQGSKTVDKEI